MKTLDWTGLLLGLLLCSCQQETDSGLLSLTLNDVGLINPGQELSLDALGNDERLPDQEYIGLGGKS